MNTEGLILEWKEFLTESVEVFQVRDAERPD